MYYLRKTVTIAAAHFLPDYNGDCRNIHGHNWKITVTCRGKDFAIGKEDCILVDFAEIKRVVKSLDHSDKLLNEFINPPTAENIAKYIYDMIPFCVQVEVEETPGSVAIYNQDPQGRII